MRMRSWRRRAAALALLLLIPLTLAPRTSWTLDSVMYDLAPRSPRPTVRVNTGVPLNLLVTSRSDEATVAHLEIDVTLDGSAEGADVAGASRGCSTTGTHVVCAVPLKPRGEAAVTVVGRPLAKGQLLFNVTEGLGGEKFGTVAVDAVPPTVAAQSGPRR